MVHVRLKTGWIWRVVQYVDHPWMLHCGGHELPGCSCWHQLPGQAASACTRYFWVQSGWDRGSAQLVLALHWHHRNLLPVLLPGQSSGSCNSSPGVLMPLRDNVQSLEGQPRACVVAGCITACTITDIPVRDRCNGELHHWLHRAAGPICVVCC